MTTKKEIEFIFSRKDYEDIYFKDYNGDYFSSPTTKRAFRTLLVIIILLMLISVYSIVFGNYSLLIFGSIILIIAIINYFGVFWNLRKWKIQIKDFLDKEEKYDRHKIVLSENYISLVQDDNENIEKWSSFKNAEISNEYISIEGKEILLIPSKSVSEENYTVLKDYISNKLK